MLFFAVALESVSFFANTVGFFAMESWKMADSSSFHFALTLGLTTCLQHEPGASLPERHIAHRRRKRAVGQLPPRRLSCVVRGRLVLLALQYQSKPFPVGILRSGPWPQTITEPQKQLKLSALNKKKTHKEKDRRKRQKRRARERAHAQG
jgi:hypothetical protein